MKLQRLIAILTALLQRERISASDLASMFEVSVRTIYRDIQSLEQAGIPIVTHTGVGGGISIIADYKIDKKLFTNEDISTLLTSLYSVSGSIPAAKLNQTLEKVRGLIPTEYSSAIELTSKQLYIDLTPWANNPHVSQTLMLIKEALAKSKIMQFFYTVRHGEGSRRKVEPHQLILKENNWYLKAYCLERQSFRTFKLRQMEDVCVMPESFNPREFETGMTDFKDWQSPQLIDVELIADASLRERALDYCRDEYIKEMEDGRLHIKMPFVESEMGYGVLLSMGHLCEVISPEHIRAGVIWRLKQMKNIY